MSLQTRVEDILTRAITDGRVTDGLGKLTLGPIERLVGILASEGVCPRESVGVSLQNGRACIETYVALARLGAVAVCLPPSTAAEERRVLMARAGCRLMVTDVGIETVAQHEPFRGWPDSISWVLHSSGSTGRPKPIALTWRSVEVTARDTIRALGVKPGAVHLGSMSQCYANGLFNSFLLPLATEGRVYLGPIATVANFGAYMRAVREAAADVLWVNPTVVSVLSRRAEPRDVASVHALVSCTAPLSRDACVTAEGALKRPVLQSYGLAETLIVSVEWYGRSAADEFSAGIPVAGPGSVFTGGEGTLEIVNGAVTPGYVKFCEGEVLCELPGGSPGERFVSADRGQFDEGGRLHVLGRLGGVMNIGGVKIGAEQMEEVLRAYPGITNAIVVGIRSTEGVEKPAALLEAQDDIDREKVALHCVSAVGPAGRPGMLRIIPRLPVTANGKVDRRAAEDTLRAVPR